MLPRDSSKIKKMRSLNETIRRFCVGPVRLEISQLFFWGLDMNLNESKRAAFFFSLFGFISTAVCWQDAWAGMWKYRDARGSVHFVKERAAIPPRFRHTAQPVDGGNSSGNLRTAPGAKLGGTHQEAAPQQEAEGALPSAELAPQKEAAPRAAELAPQQDDDLTDVPQPAQASGALAMVAKIMANPRTKTIGQALGSAETINALEAMMANPNKLYGAGAMLVWLFIIAFFKWRIDRNIESGFIKGLFIKLMLTAVFFVGSVGISYVVYGQPLVVLFNALKKGFFQ